MSSGIYFIKSPSGKMYIGSAVDVLKRWHKHRHLLAHNKHPSLKLSAACIKYAKEGLEYGVLEYCPPELLVEREQHWISLLKPAYNARTNATSNLGLKHSEEHRERLSAAHKKLAADPAHRQVLAERSRQAWADPKKKAARVAKLKAVWTEEKRAEQAERQKGIDNGERARTVRWSDPAQREALSERMKAQHAGRPNKRTVQDIEAIVISNPNWKCVSVAGASQGDLVTVRCEAHDHEETRTVREVVHKKRGCRLCGFQRSSDKQKGIPRNA